MPAATLIDLSKTELRLGSVSQVVLGVLEKWFAACDSLTEEDITSGLSGLYFDSGGSSVSRETLATIDSLLSDRGKALELLNIGISQGEELLSSDAGRLQFAAVDAVHEANAFTGLIPVLRLKNFQVVSAIEHGDVEKAVGESIGLYHAGEVASRCRLSWLMYIASTMAKSMAIRRMVQLAFDRRVSAQSLDLFMSTLARDTANEDGFCESMLSPFLARIVPAIREVEDQNVLHVLKTIGAILISENSNIVGYEERHPTLFEREWLWWLKNRTMLDRWGAFQFLLDGHPRAFNKHETLMLLGDHLRMFVDQVSEKPRLKLLEFGGDWHRCYTQWPRFLWFSESMADFHVSEYKLAALNINLNSFDNPVGKLFFGDIARFIDGHLQAFRLSRLEDLWDREYAKAAIGASLYQRQFNSRPVTLQSLVDRDILKELPRCPFTQMPLTYYRDTGVIECNLQDSGFSMESASWERVVPFGSEQT